MKAEKGLKMKKIAKNDKPVISYRMKYRLLETVDGKLTDFDPEKKEYVGYIEAPTAKKAEENLRKDFHMLKVEVLGKPERVEISREEYDNN